MSRKSLAWTSAWVAATLVVLGTFGVWRSEALRWRLQVIALVLSGQIPDLGMADTLRMMRPGSLIWLGGLAESHNPYASIVDPYVSAADLDQGQVAFRADCAGCHGTDARGREGAPALVDRELINGDSDWAMYRTVLRGVPGTAMAAHRLDPKTIWQVIAYVRSLSSSVPTPEKLAASADLPDVRLSAAELETAKEPGEDWLTYSGSLLGTRHSRLTQITPDNVRRLAPRWIYQFPEPGDPIEVSPIERNGVLYITSASRVVALDAMSGTALWRFTRDPPPDSSACCGNVNRGVALLEDRIFVATLDAHLIALSARTGKKLWDSTVANYRQGYSITAAPIAFKDLVVTGVSGGDYPTRGLIAAFDAATGKERWRFWTVPGPGQPGNETWPGEAWKVGGGSTWMTGSYDPMLDLLYWGVANPAPVYNASTRQGDNLYTNSVVALRGTSGELVWHFQFTPGDDHDWDSAQIPVIVDRPEADNPRQLLWANRNGFLYVLNRVTGKFLRGAPFVRQTWAEGLDTNGQPIHKQDIAPSPRGTLVYPSTTGGTSWWSPSYDPKLDLMIIPALERGGIYFSGKVPAPEPQEEYLGGASGGITGAPHYSVVIAVNPRDASIAWRHQRPPKISDPSFVSGLLSTASGLVFATGGQTFEALDSHDGRALWSFEAGARMSSSPTTYAVAGTQFVTVAAGRLLIAFTLVGN